MTYNNFNGVEIFVLLKAMKLLHEQTIVIDNNTESNFKLEIEIIKKLKFLEYRASEDENPYRIYLRESR